MKNRLRNGWVFIDVLVGIMLVVILAAILSTAAGMERRSIRHLDDSRAACHLAESALLSMSGGKPLAAGAPVSVRELRGSPQIDGMKWIEVQAKVNGCAASLVGCVPENAARPAGD